jgi:hypothetical protein
LIVPPAAGAHCAAQLQETIGGEPMSGPGSTVTWRKGALAQHPWSQSHGAATQASFWQICCAPQAPHEPPQPSSPQLFPEQLRVHWKMQAPDSHRAPRPHEPHEPPQPSSPHCLPAHCGEQIGPASSRARSSSPAAQAASVARPSLGAASLLDAPQAPAC